MTKYIVSIIALFYFNLCSAQNKMAEIHNIVKTASEMDSSLSISLGFHYDNHAHYLNYGYTNHTDRVEVDLFSIFEIGSITKLFTAYLIAEQAALGNIDLNETIDAYLPLFLVLNSAIQNKIKVSDLASHQSGLPDFDFQKMMRIDPNQPLDLVTKETVDSVLRNTVELETYGSYQYSNISFVLLGYILENVTQTSYEALIKERMLVPFGMKNTMGSDFEDKNHTIGYNAKGEEKDFFNWNSVIAPAGLLKSNAQDLLEFVHVLMNTENDAITNELERTYFKNTFIELGFGLNIIRENEHVIFAKTGDTLGQSTVLAYNPVQNWGIVILTNQANGTARKMFEEILEVMSR